MLEREKLYSKSELKTFRNQYLISKANSGNYSLEDLAHYYGLSDSSVYEILKSAGVTIKRRSSYQIMNERLIMEKLDMERWKEAEQMKSQFYDKEIEYIFGTPFDDYSESLLLRLNALKKNNISLSDEIVKLSNEVKKLQAMNADLVEEIERTQAVCQEIELENSISSDESLSSLVLQARNKIKDWEDSYYEQLRMNAEHQDNIRELKNLNEEIEKKLIDVQVDLDITSTLCDGFEKHNATLERVIKEKKKSYSDLEDKYDALNKKYNRLQKKMDKRRTSGHSKRFTDSEKKIIEKVYLDCQGDRQKTKEILLSYGIEISYRYLETFTKNQNIFVPKHYSSKSCSGKSSSKKSKSKKSTKS